MSDRATRTAGDRGATIDIELGGVLNLTGATITGRIWRNDGEPPTERDDLTGTILDPDTRTIRLNCGTTDTDWLPSQDPSDPHGDEWKLKVRATFGDGSRQHFPSGPPLRVLVTPAPP